MGFQILVQGSQLPTPISCLFWTEKRVNFSPFFPKLIGSLIVMTSDIVRTLRRPFLTPDWFLIIEQFFQAQRWNTKILITRISTINLFVISKSAKSKKICKVHVFIQWLLEDRWAQMNLSVPLHQGLCQSNLRCQLLIFMSILVQSTSLKLSLAWQINVCWEGSFNNSNNLCSH